MSSVAVSVARGFRGPRAPSSQIPPQPALSTCQLLVGVLECYMTMHIRRNDARRDLPIGAPSVFHALHAPCITPVEYLRRLTRYSFCSRSVFVVAFLYLQRVAHRASARLLLTSLSVHRLLLVAVLLATKMLDDVLYDNAHFAKVGGLELRDLNMLELNMLALLDFDLYVTPAAFEAFETSVVRQVINCPLADFSLLRHRLANCGYGVPPRQSCVAPCLPGAACSPVTSADEC